MGCPLRRVGGNRQPENGAAAFSGCLCFVQWGVTDGKDVGELPMRRVWR
nr:hypothetical protein [uncultured Kingella sp.]